MGCKIVLQEIVRRFVLQCVPGELKCVSVAIFTYKRECVR